MERSTDSLLMLNRLQMHHYMEPTYLVRRPGMSLCREGELKCLRTTLVVKGRSPTASRVCKVVHEHAGAWTAAINRLPHHT